MSEQARQPRLGVVVVSTREGRIGLAIARWFEQQARAHGGFDVEFVDLKAVGLPLLEEPNHPRLQKYVGERTRAWSATVAALDAFVFVTPEYNFSMAPSLVNALDHLYVEWTYKAAGLVSYGGLSGGLRSAQVTRQLIASFKMVPIVESVTVQWAGKAIDKATGAFQPAEEVTRSVKPMLDEILKWERALATLRRQAPS